jgi:hypothetical protein
MNTSQSPVAAAAPVLRAREIWLIGSNTTRAPAAAAIAAVRSVELLSQTISSADHPACSKATIAARMRRSDSPSNFSSLYAGMTRETFTSSIFYLPSSIFVFYRRRL